MRLRFVIIRSTTTKVKSLPKLHCSLFLIFSIYIGDVNSMLVPFHTFKKIPMHLSQHFHQKNVQCINESNKYTYILTYLSTCLFTFPASTKLATMMIALMFCSTTILQKSPMVHPLTVFGPCAAMYRVVPYPCQPRWCERCMV